VRSDHSSHLTSSDIISIDLISSELSHGRRLAATGNWVASQHATQFSMAVTVHNALISESDEMRSVEMRSAKIRSHE